MALMSLTQSRNALASANGKTEEQDMSRTDLEKDLLEIDATYQPRIQMLREMLEDEGFKKLEYWKYLLELEEELTEEYYGERDQRCEEYSELRLLERFLDA